MTLFIVTLGGEDLSRRKLSFSLWPLLSMVEEQLSEKETHPAQHLPHTTDMGEWGWQRMRSIHAWGWAQGNLTPTSQSTAQQELGVMPCDVLYLHLSGAPCEGHAVSASVHCYRSAPVTHNHQAREGYCWHPSAVKTELKMQQSATGAVSYCQ